MAQENRNKRAVSDSKLNPSIPYLEESGVRVRDIGNLNQSPSVVSVMPLHSLKNNNLFNSPSPRLSSLMEKFYLARSFQVFWSKNYSTNPRGFRIHRSYHPYLLFAASMYLPYRFRAQIKTAILLKVLSPNPYVNLSAKFLGWTVILGGMAFLS